jgi:alpha-galactosidase
LKNHNFKGVQLMRQIFLATTALSLCLALAACNDDKGSSDNSSTFNGLNEKIAQLDSAQQQNKATIDDQNKEIASLKQARADDTAAFETRLAAVVKAVDERPDISPELEKRLVALQEQIGKVPAFETAEEFEAFKSKVETLRTDLDNAPKSAKLTELSDSLTALSDKFASATDFKQVKDYVDGVKTKLEALLAAADPEVLIRLKDTLATLRTDLTGKTTFTDADIRGFTDRIAGLEKLIDTKVDIVYTPSKPLPPLPRFSKPPMGWNAWNSYQTNVSSVDVKAVADTFVSSGMKEAGYTYVNLDDGWTKQSTLLPGGKTTSTRDTDGNIIVDATRFPQGIKDVADYVRSKGLKFGIYSSPYYRTCANLSGSLGYETQDAKKYAEWGVEYLKYDWCGGDFGGFAPMRAALDEASPDRPIYLAANPQRRPSMISYPYTNIVDAATFVADIGSGWTKVMGYLDNFAAYAAYTVPGYINNPDMLQVGNGDFLDKAKAEAHFGMWAMLGGPLIAGNKIVSQSETIRAALTNKEVIAVNQDDLGLQAVQLTSYGTSKQGIQVWARPLAEDGTRAVFVLNRGSSTASTTLNFADFGLSGTIAVRDLQEHKDLAPAASGSMLVTVPATSGRMFKFKGSEASLKGRVALADVKPIYAVETAKQSGDCPVFAEYDELPFDTSARWDALANPGKFFFEDLTFCWKKDPNQTKSGLVPKIIRGSQIAIDASAAGSSSSATSLAIGKATYERGIIGSTQSQLIYRLGGQCSLLTSLAGVDNQSKPEGEGAVTFDIWGDNKPLYVTPKMKKGDEAINFKVDVSGVKTLRIIARGSESGLFAALANPKLQCVSGS